MSDLDGAPQPTGGVLALDLARSTGWAYGLPDWRQPWFGHWVAPLIALEADRFLGLEEQFKAAYTRWEPAHLILESALPPRAQGDTAAARQAYGLRALAITRATEVGIPYTEVSAALVRNDLMGKPYLGQEPKKQVIAFLHARGIRVHNGDQADAVMLWLWRQRTQRGLAPVAGPLFVNR